jgi:phosphoribosyl 1,2-cyclic phosphodiesterase
MKLTVISSSSDGNSYILENDQEAIIIECGVRFERIMAALDYNLGKVCCCLVTHEHKDHCFSVKDVLKASITVAATIGTIRQMGIPPTHHRIKQIEAGKLYEFGGFRVIPFKIEHDVAEPVGFLINHAETGNVLFVTDTYLVPNTFRDLHNIIIEANFSQDIINKRNELGLIQDWRQARIYKSHMSVETCLTTLKANDLSKVNNIVLIHLSDGNSHAEMFKQMVSEATGKSVHIAEPGLIIENFNKQPF